MNNLAEGYISVIDREFINISFNWCLSGNKAFNPAAAFLNFLVQGWILP